MYDLIISHIIFFPRSDPHQFHRDPVQPPRRRQLSAHLTSFGFRPGLPWTAWTFSVSPYDVSIYMRIDLHVVLPKYNRTICVYINIYA